MLLENLKNKPEDNELILIKFVSKFEGETCSDLYQQICAL